jgi:Family of unknown function (DUF6375)
MKIWNSYGSEHSANLVLIGRFQEATDAAKAKALIDLLVQFADGKVEELRGARKFPPEALDLFMKNNIAVVGPAELEQFCYDVDVKLSGNEIVITTEEYDISAFLKIMVINSGRIEVYSARDYKGTGYGRGAKARQNHA